MIPNQITTSRFDSWLRRALRIRDRSVVPALATELLAVTGLELDRPEHYWPAETALVEGGSSVITGAGDYADMGVRNPTGSGLLIVVRDATVVPVTSPASFFWGLRVEQATTNRNAVIRDSRQAGPGGITSQGGVHFSAAVPGPLTSIAPRLATAINSPLKIPGAWVLTPGWEFVVNTPVAANTVQCAFSWYERAMEPSEERGG